MTEKVTCSVCGGVSEADYVHARKVAMGLLSDNQDMELALVNLVGHDWRERWDEMEGKA